jgi:protein-L-isoaspartate(D-aspartate) O-methyltransferase
MTAMPKTTALDFVRARYNMIESQLRPNQVNNLRLIDAISEIPREMFVPSGLVGISYLDENIPLVSGRFLMQPMILARLIQAAEVKDTDRVLDLAPATGYSSVILGKLADSVVGVEPDALLHKEAEINKNEYSPHKVEILAGAPIEGCAIYAPFNVILINGSVEYMPEILFDQLAEGGRLVAVVRQYGTAHAAHTGQARLYRKQGNKISFQSLFDANVPPAPGFMVPKTFEF